MQALKQARGFQKAVKLIAAAISMSLLMIALDFSVTGDWQAAPYLAGLGPLLLIVYLALFCHRDKV